MKNINEIIASLNVARSNNCDKEKSEEFKSIIQDLLPYGEIEQELGINLVTLFRVLKQGFYFKDDFGDIEYISKEMISILTNGKFEELKKDIKDYGKTWALTKGELL